jgi:hypothetical protein
MGNSVITSVSDWRVMYPIMWHNTPKKFRKTIAQVNYIRSQAKVYVAMFGQN